MRAAGLILAAGESRRMGSPKALLEFEGETFLDRLVRLFTVHCVPVVVVLGAGAEAIRSAVRRDSGAVFANNQDWRRGQLSSMQCGLRALPRDAPGVLFTLVDHPRVQPATLARLLEPGADLRIPRFAGRRGHPVYWGAPLIGELLALPPESTARDVVERHAAEVEYIDVDDPGVLDDIDEPSDYMRLRGALR